jgi:hypothetical protein
MKSIIERKQLTYVFINDGTIVCTEKTPTEIGAYLDKHSHILIEWELFSKFCIEKCRNRDITEVEVFVSSLSLQGQREMRKILVEREKSGNRSNVQIAMNIAEKNNII